MSNEKVIDFYFDFLSPYGYFGSTKIDALAERNGYTVNWKVFLVGAAFKKTGQKSAGDRSTIYQQYGFKDVMRQAAFFGAPFKFPKVFGTSVLAPSRAYYWLYDRDQGLAKDYAKKVYQQVFALDVDMRKLENLSPILTDLGLNSQEVLAWASSDEGKDRFRSETDAAIARGVFGSPYFFVGDEGFWGSDRMNTLEWWLMTHGDRAAEVSVK
jgi:2-hydroxychromene-2-carboxylate isomerase